MLKIDCPQCGTENSCGWEISPDAIVEIVCVEKHCSHAFRVKIIETISAELFKER